MKFNDTDILKNKKLLILGGSRNDIEIIRAAKDMGIKVGVTDWYDTKKSPAKLEADEYFNVSVSDIDALLKLMKNNNYDGVLTGFTDSYLEFYSELCEKGGYYCYSTSNLLRDFTNKSVYKKYFEKYGVPTLKNYKIKEIDDEFNDYPIVLKPVDGSGGKGLKIAYNYEEYKSQLEDCISTSKEGEIVIEPFIEERKELTAFFIFIDGKVYYPGCGNRFLSKSQGNKIGLPVLYTLPSSYEENFKKNVLPYMVNMFEDLGFKNGILFAQSIVKGDNIYVYDIGYRITGSLEYKLFKELYGIDTLKMLIHYSLTGKMNFYGYNIEEILSTNRIGVNVTMLGKEGTVSKILGRDKIMEIPGIIDVTIKTVPGDKITKEMIGTLGQIVVRIFFTADNLEKALDIIDDVYSKIQILDENGENMILDVAKREEIIGEYKK